jgi:glutathione synthase/RimK-type ligase-like ATP-grasp enzyme
MPKKSFITNKTAHLIDILDSRFQVILHQNYIDMPGTWYRLFVPTQAQVVAWKFRYGWIP